MPVSLVSFTLTPACIDLDEGIGKEENPGAGELEEKADKRRKNKTLVIANGQRVTCDTDAFEDGGRK